MKKIMKYLFSAFAVLGILTSCNDFGDVNDDPEHMTPNTVNYTYMFTQVQTQIAGSDWDVWRNGCIYTMNMMQHTTSVNWTQGVFYTWNGDYNSAYWDGFYSGGRAAIRNIIEVADNWKDKPAYQNEYQYSRVMKAYLFQRMTDLYGDVPYFDAGKGLLVNDEKYSYVKYDTQEAIYDDLLKELDEVNTALKTPAATNNLNKADLIYSGDSEKWRKFANSLMLRVAMRLTKVDPTKASLWAKKAVENGVFTSSSDNAAIIRESAQVSNDSAEPYGKILSDSDPQAFYLSEYFINNLKSTEDPRLQMIATRCDNPSIPWSSGNNFDLGSNADPKKLVGMPIGYTTSGEWSIYNSPGFKEQIPDSLFRKYYALPNRKTYARPDAPSMLVTYTETNLLLADAAARGFIGGDAKTYFRSGVEAAMGQFSFYPAAKSDYDLYLNATAVSTYLNKRLTAFDSNPLEEINWQYYVTTFCDEYETFANWRRSGYPELKSVYSAPFNRPVYPNSVTTEIPRRFTYPASESQYNSTNYDEAVSRLQGGDVMSARVWWDK